MVLISSFVLSGCESHIANSLKSSFADGKSIVVVPKPILYDTWTFWMREGDTKSRTYFSNGYTVGRDYIAKPMDAGTYYIRRLSVADRKDKSLSYEKEHNATLGYISIIKTPEKSLKRIQDKDGKYIDKKVDIDSYYKTDDIVFDDGEIGAITIKPNEVVLVPSVSMDMEIAQDSCKVINNKEEPFLLQLLSSDKKTLLGKFWDTAGTTNGLETWEWKCPIKSFFVTMRTKQSSHFIANVNTDSFPKELIDILTVRGFEFGDALKKAGKLEVFVKEIEQYEITER
jgi:hypothetical protein